MSEIAQSWKRIRNWWKQHASSRRSFAPGASAAELKKLESVLGFKLPKDFKESYREVNGSGGSGILPFGMCLLSLDEVADQWRTWCEVIDDEGEDEAASDSGPFKSVTWNKRWVPFSHSGSGDHDCIDMDPGKGGTVGQVIDFSHEEGPLGVTAGSLREWLLGFAEDLERGVYQYEKRDDGITRVDGSPRPKYVVEKSPQLAEKLPQTAEFLNLPGIADPSAYADAVAKFKEFRRAIRNWAIAHAKRSKKSEKTGTPYEEVKRVGVAELKKVYDQYCQTTKDLSLSYSQASEPERDFPIVSVTGKGKKVQVVIQNEVSPGNFDQYEYTLVKVGDGYKVSDKVKIYDPFKKRFTSYYLLMVPC